MHSQSDVGAHVLHSFLDIRKLCSILKYVRSCYPVDNFEYFSRIARVIRMLTVWGEEVNLLEMFVTFEKQKSKYYSELVSTDVGFGLSDSELEAPLLSALLS